MAYKFPLTSIASPKQISLDDEELAHHPATTEDIRVCCQDIKVLGRKELRYAVGWGGYRCQEPQRQGKACEGHDIGSLGIGCCVLG